MDRLTHKKTPELHSHTFAQIAAESPRIGLMAIITRVSFQPLMNPTMNPAKNVATAWKNIPTLSPIPSLILEMSLKKIIPKWLQEGGLQFKSDIDIWHLYLERQIKLVHFTASLFQSPKLFNDIFPT